MLAIELANGVSSTVDCAFEWLEFSFGGSPLLENVVEELVEHCEDCEWIESGLAEWCTAL